MRIKGEIAYRDSNKTMAGCEEGKSAKYYVTVFVLLCYAFYSHLMPSTVAYAVFFVGAIMAVAVFLSDGGLNFDLTSIGWFSLWLVFALVIAGSHLLGNGIRFGSTVIHIACLVLVAISANSIRWVMPAINILIILLIPYALLTIAMYFLPSLSSAVGFALFPNNANFMGYRSGIAAHYSDNGICNALGLISSFCFWCFAPQNNTRKKTWLCVSALFLFALILTTKRTPVIVALLSVVILYLSTRQAGKAVRAVVVVAAAAFALFSLSPMIPWAGPLVQRFADAIFSNDFSESTSGRVQIWQFAIEGWLDSPLFGNGWTSFDYIWPNGITHSTVAHNELLNLLYEIGIIGTVVALFCIVMSYYVTYSLARSTERIGLPSLFLRVSLGIQTYFLVAAFTMETIFMKPVYFVPYLLAVAITLAVKVHLPAGNIDNAKTKDAHGRVGR